MQKTSEMIAWQTTEVEDVTFAIWFQELVFLLGLYGLVLHCFFYGRHNSLTGRFVKLALYLDLSFG